MIEVKEAVKVFGKVRALDGLNMRVPKGVVYGLVGPNGAGKTTVLQHICGSMRPDEGQVLVEGEPVWENTLIKAKIATIPSDIYFYNQATIQDMHDLYAGLYAASWDEQRFMQLQPLFGLDASARFRDLSKGMKKQAAFWITLSQRPELLLLDEPVDGLDPAARHKVWGVVMEEVAERGMTVLTSSHNLRELTDVCDYVGIMESGRMHLERTLSELQDNFVKVQVAFEDDVLKAPAGFELLNQERQGRLFTLVVKGSAAQVEVAFEQYGPVFINILPLSLEEVFIYEMGGVSHEAILG